jgi:hypothetical protein
VDLSRRVRRDPDFVSGCSAPKENNQGKLDCFLLDCIGSRLTYFSIFDILVVTKEYIIIKSPWSLVPGRQPTLVFPIKARCHLCCNNCRG